MSLPVGDLGPGAPSRNSALHPNVSARNRAGGHYLKYLDKYKPQTQYRPTQPRWRQGYELSEGYRTQNLQVPNTAETSFTEGIRTPQEPNISSIGEGIRQRRPIQRQEGNNSSGNRLRASTTPRTETRIDIPSTGSGLGVSSETVPLLGAAAGNSVLGGASTSGLGIGAGIAGVGAAAGLGYAAKVATDYVDERGAVLPGSDYIGPGNPIYEGPAKSIEDQIARDHDLGYSEVLYRAQREKWPIERFNAEIGHLDETAFDAFWNRYSTAGDWKSLIGYLGLKGKHSLEYYTGTLYPQFSGKCDLLRNRLTSVLIGID